MMMMINDGDDYDHNDDDDSHDGGDDEDNGDDDKHGYKRPADEDRKG